jgi:N-methylhydantoinase B/oxoprolinase/acetone carboxylase alpha subunit
MNRRGYLSMNYTGAANAGGGGARHDMDGENALGFYWGPWTDAGEIEEQDDRMAQLTLARGLDKNFHGFGKYRGGTPLVEVNTFCSACVMSSWGSCDKLSFNFGLFGGYAGPPNPRFVIRDTDLMEQIKEGKELSLGQYDLLSEQKIRGQYILTSSSKDAEPFKEGDVVVSSVGAGGGYGDVLDRDPELVLRDLNEKLITIDIAERIYGIALDSETAFVDHARTRQLREAIRADRLAKGEPFETFIVKWLQRKPKDEILTHYGNWPEPHLKSYTKPFWGMYD